MIDFNKIFSVDKIVSFSCDKELIDVTEVGKSYKTKIWSGRATFDIGFSNRDEIMIHTKGQEEYDEVMNFVLPAFKDKNDHQQHLS